jgi:hypothetical protein
LATRSSRRTLSSRRANDSGASTFYQFIPLPGFGDYLIISGPRSDTFASGFGDFSGDANTGEVQLQIGNSISGLSLTAGSASSFAHASLEPCPSTASLEGGSSVGTLLVNGTGYDGAQSQTINVPGVATISVNQQTVTNSTITQRALDIKLTALNEEIVIAESSAGGACA